MSWALSSQQDSVGNAVNYFYDNSPINGHYLTQIDYAYGAGNAANARVRLEYRAMIISGVLS